MHHVALDGPRAHDRHLDDEVVEAARPHPGQEVHLGAGFHLEDAQRIGGAEHVVDRGVLGREGGERVAGAVVGGDQVEGLADAGEHAEGEDVDLEDAERVDVVLVPADDGAVLHRGVLDGDELVEPTLGDHEAADMLREVAGEADDLVHEVEREREAAVGGVEADLGQPVARQAGAAPAPDLRGERGDGVAAEAHGGADLAQRPLGTVVDHRGAEPGAVAAVAAVEVLDHLLAAFVLEVDVDVGRLVARLGDEALEDHGADLGRDRGDAEGVADDGIRRRAAALAEDAAGPGEVHHIVHGQEIGRVVQPADQREFVRDLGAHPVRRAGGIAPGEAAGGQTFEPGLGILAVPDLPGVFVAQLVEGEAAGFGDLARAVHGMRVTLEVAQHVGLGPQAALGVQLGGAADAVDDAPLADAGQHVEQAAARAVVHQRLGTGDERQAEGAGGVGEIGDAGGILAVVAGRGGEVEAGKPGGEGAGGGEGLGRERPGQVQEECEARAEGVEIGGIEPALALGRAAGAGGQQPAEPAPGGAVLRQGGDLGAVGQAEPGGGDQAGHGAAGLARHVAQFLMGADEARDRVAVGDGEGGQAEVERAAGVFLRMAAAGEEGEVRGDAELGEGHGA